MAKEIVMPKLSDTMTEGLLGSWLKSVGDRVERGDTIAEVETDKATMGLEAFDSGVLLEQRVAAGTVVPVGTVLGTIGAAGEALVSGAEAQKPAATPQAEPSTPEPVAVTPASTAPSAGEKAAPIVRRRARELGVDLATVVGSGPGGRILLTDLERQPSPEASTGKAPLSGAESHQSPIAGREMRMRAAIARSVSASWQEIPHIYLTVDIAMDTAEEVRRELQLAGSPVSVNDLVLKGVTIALARFPLLNGHYGTDGLEPAPVINLGMAVNVPGGLVVPVIADAGSRSLAEIALLSRGLVETARRGALTPDLMEGGTFSVSNLGPQGVSQFTALILPPQVGILAVGAVRETVVPRAGAAVVGNVMTVTLAADHRAVDGAYGAGFLQEFKALLESPVRLLV
jgi:pyruvate dehydrogenase E2 component (dihydrolipoamide acetyltransferase)